MTNTASWKENIRRLDCIVAQRKLNASPTTELTKTSKKVSKENILSAQDSNFSIP